MLTPADLRRPLPGGWSLLVGLDTGTYMSATFTVFPTDSWDAYVVYEQPNYRYVAGQVELLDYSIPSWCRELLGEYRKWKPGADKLTGWLDTNSQFKSELRRYGVHGLGNRRSLELRVEISREYMNNRRVHLAPWLKVLPWELEHAKWPDETTSAGRLEREKENDHTLDCLEHSLSRRPRHKSMVEKKSETFLQRHLRLHRRRDLPRAADSHLGAN